MRVLDAVVYYNAGEADIDSCGEEDWCDSDAADVSRFYPLSVSISTS